MKPKISILVPVYGVEKFIERCAISLFEQTFDDIEYIFVNDCTPDNSIKILEEVINKYPSRRSFVKIFNHQSNKGIAATRNSLIEKSNGEFLLFVDSDDYLELNAIRLLYDKAINEKSDIVIFDYFLEWANVKKLIKQNWDKNSIVMVEKILSVEVGSSLWGKLIRSSLFIDNNIRMTEGINFGEDFMILPKVIYHAQKISKLDVPLYHYMQTNINSYTTKKQLSHIDNIILVLNDLSNFFENKLDSQLYEKSLLKGKLRKKIEVLMEAEGKYIIELINILPETNKIEDISFLSKRERIVFFLIKNESVILLKFYKNLYSKLFSIIQIIKKRN